MNIVGFLQSSLPQISFAEALDGYRLMLKGICALSYLNLFVRCPQTKSYMCCSTGLHPEVDVDLKSSLKKKKKNYQKQIRDKLACTPVVDLLGTYLLNLRCIMLFSIVVLLYAKFQSRWSLKPVC